MRDESQATGCVRVIVWAVLAVVVAVAMLFVCSMPAMAENTAAGITDTGAQGAQSVEGSQTVKQGGAQGVQSDATSNGSDADSGSDSGDSPSVRSDADDKAAAVADGQDDCGNVLTWQTLAGCVSGTTSQTVTIAQTITVPDNASATIAKSVSITLTAKPGVDPAMTSQTNGDTIFNVAPGASLTIGTDKDDANFSYKDGKRFLVFLQNGGNLTVNNGMFSGIDTTGSTNHDMGTLALV